MLQRDLKMLHSFTDSIMKNIALYWSIEDKHEDIIYKERSEVNSNNYSPTFRRRLFNFFWYIYFNNFNKNVNVQDWEGLSKLSN